MLSAAVLKPFICSFSPSTPSFLLSFSLSFFCPLKLRVEGSADARFVPGGSAEAQFVREGGERSLLDHSFP